MGNPFTEQEALGPLINETQLKNVDRIVSETVAAGAEVRAGGKRRELFYEPTGPAGVTSSMAAFREEIFGPVAPVVIVHDEDEAVANDTAYGSVAAIQTRSADRAGISQTATPPESSTSTTKPSTTMRTHRSVEPVRRATERDSEPVAARDEFT